MPHYDYRCSQCGKFTVYQGIKEKALASCPTCGSPVHRLIGKNVNVMYKCSGFYCTDTPSSSGRNGGDSGKGAENTTGSDNKAVNE